ncbi:MAG: PAS domain S-box protein [bacterium]
MKTKKSLRRTRPPQSKSSEETFHLLFHHHPLPMWVYDLKTLAFLDVNGAAIDKYGYTLEEFLKMTLKDILPAEDVARLLDDAAKEGPELQHSGEWRLKLKDGHIINVEFTSHSVEHKKREAALVIAQNITERKLSEEKNHRHSVELSTLLKISQELAATLNLSTILQTTTDRVAELTELKSSAIYLLEGETLRLWATTPPLPPHFPEELRNAPLADHPHICIAITTGLPVFLPDTATADLTPAERAVTEIRDLRSILYLPLIAGTKVLGTIIVSTAEEPRVLSEPEISLCSTLANLAALAIENARLYESTQRYAADLEQRVIELNQAEEKILKANRVYAVISQINQAIVRIRDRDKLFEETCRIAIEYGKFQMAWLGLVDEGTKYVYPVTFAGVEDGYLTKIRKISISDVPEGRGPTGTAIREGKHFVCEDIENDQRMAPWKDEALKRGYRSSIALPIKLFGKVIGAFSIYAHTPHFFDQEEIKLLDEVTNDISFALETIETEKKRQQAVEALRESEGKFRKLLESTPLPLCYVNKDGVITFRNERFIKVFGYTNDDVPTLAEWWTNAYPEVQYRQWVVQNWESAVQRAAETGTDIESEEYHVTCRDGNVREIIISGITIDDNFLATFIDITERKRAEETIQRNEAVLRLFVEHSPAAIAMFDSEMKYIVASRRYLIDYDLGEQDVVGRSHYEIFPEIPERWKEIHKRCLAGETERADADPFPRMSGKLDWVRWEIRPWYEHNNEISGIILFSEVITERRKIEMDRDRMFNLSIDMLSISGFDGYFKQLNPAWEKTLGWKNEELKSKPYIEFVHPDDREPTINAASGLSEGKTVMTFDNRYLCKDGSYKWISWSSYPLVDEKLIFAMARDITERKRAEEVLDETHKQYRQALIQAKAVPYIRYYHEDFYNFIGEDIINYTGYSVEEFIPSLWKELRQEVIMLEECAGLTIEEAGQLVREGKRSHWLADYKIKTRNGEIRWINDTASQIKDQEGKIIGSLGVLQDVTERKKAEEAIRESEEKYHSLFENMLEGFAYCKMLFEDGHPQDFVYLDVNHKFEELTGLINVTGKKVSEVIPGIKESNPELLELYGRVALTGKPERFESYLPTLDMWFSIAVYSNQKEYFIAVFDVITERKQAEEGLKRLNAELEQRVAERTRELTLAMENAQDADRIKSEFLAAMSHELRTPLNSIIGFSSVLLQRMAGPLNEEQSKQLTMVSGSAHHLLELINDVLDISKIEAGQLQISKKPFDLRMIFLTVVETSLPAAEKKGISLRMEIGLDVGVIVSDQRRVEQILINLINNAIKFTERGEIHITCRGRDGWIETSVRDTGIGIRAENIDKLFQPFQQMETGLTRSYEGTGLGLSICKNLLELLGGTITVESEYGMGSTFTFTLPLAKEIK